MQRFLLAGALILAPASLAGQGMASLEEALNSITEEDVRNRIAVIADDSMFGRNTPSPGLEATANYIAGQFYSFGLEPLGDAGSYQQRYPLNETAWDLEASHLTIAGTRLSAGDEFQILFARRGTGPVDSEAVIISGSLGDAEEFAALELEGKIVFVVVPTVMGDYDGGWFGLVRPIFRSGTASIILVSQRNDEAFAAESALLARPSVAKGWGAADPAIGFMEIRDSRVADLFADAGFDLVAARRQSSGPITMTPLNAEVSLELKQRVVNRISAPNVVAYLEGSDPELRNEYIVFSAHMDHIGISSRRDEEGDSIANGADDDASGTIAVVELAQAYAMMAERPRRSMIFLTVSGEERGLWGSEYFANNLPVSAGQIVANINIDMVARNWPDTIVVIGKEHSDLGETLDRVNAEHPELGMAAIDDLWPDENFYRRSDHFNFARKGIPILFFFNGVHEDYHGVNDEVDRIDAEKEMRIIRLTFHLGLEIANSDHRPRWVPESYESIVNPS